MLELTLNDPETYCPEVPLFEEGLPMTLTLGMMGRDGGWILAADRAVVDIDVLDPDSRKVQLPDASVRQVMAHDLSSECKIERRDNLGVWYASSGVDPTRDAGAALIEHIRQKTFDWKNIQVSLRNIASQYPLMQNRPSASDRLTIVLDDEEIEGPQLWLVDLPISPTPHRQGKSTEVRTRSRAIGGDVGNAATLFPQLYYHPSLPTDGLIKLAAFTILFASKCNPGNISEDFDLLVRRPGADDPAFIAESESRLLKEEFQGLYRSMAHSLELPFRKRKSWWRSLLRK